MPRYTAEYVSKIIAKLNAQPGDFADRIKGMYIDVKEFDAVGDGTTDDSTAIQAAITQIASYDTLLFFSSETDQVLDGAQTTGGVYKISADLTFPANISLMFGEGSQMSIDAGKTVTINGEINTMFKLADVFIGAGSYVYNGENRIDALEVCSGGNVAATNDITDNAIVRGDGGAYGVKGSLASVDTNGTINLEYGQGIKIAYPGAPAYNTLIYGINNATVYDVISGGVGHIFQLDGNTRLAINDDGIEVTGAITGDVNMSKLGTPTYGNLQDWANITQSSGKTSGGGFTDNLNGTVSVAAGTGFIRATNSDVAEILTCDWAISATLALTDNNTNYIYVDYNSGTPLVKATVTKTTVTNRDAFLLGKIYRDGTDLHIVEAGMVVTEVAKRVLTYLTSFNGEVTRATGMMISEKATQHFELTAGLLFAGLTPITFSAYDSSATNFTYWYNNGAWQSSATGTINNTQYNNYGTGLATLTNNRYGVHWVYSHDDGDIDVVYGIGDYSLASAESANPPSNLPDITANVAFLVGKIIIKKSDTTFTDVLSAFETTFTPSAVSLHNELSGLDGGTTDEYFHLESAEHVKLTRGISEVSNIKSITIDASLYKDYIDTGIDGAITVNAPTSPINGYLLYMELEDDGTTRAVTWNAVFDDPYTNATMPLNTTATKRHIVLFRYDSTAVKWKCMASDEEA